MPTTSSPRRRVGMLLLCLAVLTLGLGPGASAQRLRSLNTKHYTIHTDLPSREIKPLAKHMDLVFQGYSQRFASLVRGRAKRQNLYLVTTREQYVRTMAEFGIDGSYSGGIFFVNPKGNGLATWVYDKPLDDTLQTLQHEGFHQFAYEYFGPDLPLWLNEGMAVYFEQAKVVRGQVRSGIAEPTRVAIIRQALEKDQIMPMPDLLGITSAQWHANMSSGSPLGHLQYVQSWSVVHFLVHAQDGRFRRPFSRYLELIAGHHDADHAFAQAFGEGQIASLGRGWAKYVREDLSPDPYAEAIDRLNFLARGASFMLEQSGKPPADLDTLKQYLTERSFSVTRGSHAGTITIDSRDETVWVYTDTKGKAQGFRLTPSRQAKTPPTLSAPGLRPQPMVKWVTYGGTLQPVVDYR